MKICLVSMPWQSLESPSLPLALLGAKIRGSNRSDVVHEVHASLLWADYLLEASEGELTPRNYTNVADNGLFDGFGDWVFSGSLYDDEGWGTAQLNGYVSAHQLNTGMISDIRLMRAHVPEFMGKLAANIAAEEYDLVGFTSTFMQNVPSLALAKMLKAARPQMMVVLGGGNCDGPMGSALHRNHPFLDFVVRGEGEAVLLQLIEAIDTDQCVSSIPGLCWWDDAGRSVANEELGEPLPPAQIPAPDFDAWFDSFETTLTRDFMEPKLVYEGARGCWWGEKHQCTFCGLNGSLIQFRSKSADVVWDELTTLISRHQTLDVVMVDNILDMSFFTSLLPRLAETGWDLRIHYEVKSNLKPEHMRTLADARVAHIQPGIESLNNDVLRLMDKGTTGAQNIRTIRNGHELSLTVSWNYLYGFPGESAEHYTEVLRQLPRLVHLRPPIGVTRIALERFSPHFERPELGFEVRSPAAMYSHVYDLPEQELFDMVYLFDTPPRGIQGEVEESLHRAVEMWKVGHDQSSLIIRSRDGGELLVEDRRSGWPEATHTLSGWQAEAYLMLEQPRSAGALHRHLRDGGNIDVSKEAVESYLDQLSELGLVFDDGESYVALATWAVPARVPSVMAMQ